MKLRIFSLAILMFAMSVWSCGNDDSDAPGGNTVTITLSQKQFQVSEMQSTQTVQVTCTGREWTAFSDNNWLKVQVSGSTSSTGTVTIDIEANTGGERVGTVVVRSGSTRESIVITQAAKPLDPLGPLPDDIVAPDGYQLVWHDEFNEGSQLGNDWTHEVKNSGWVNNELQNYRNGSIDGQRTTELKDGQLHINCFKAADGKIYSGRVYAKKSTGWKYGYFEARIQLPKGKGTWPAFWMMPVNFHSWPADGEIDIMEEVGADPNWVVSTVHCTKYNNSGTSIESARKKVATAESDFHVYACEWTAQRMRFYVDGELLLTYNNEGIGTTQWPFDAPFYVILNLAWGGDWGGMRGVDNSALPITMKIDYVRVFQ